MKIILVKLVLTNFKGVRRQEIEFGDVTTISGPNASGKTTINDAFTWLLFDKDSAGRTSFEIKTLDENNQAYHRLDHEVIGHFLIDGIETVLRKCFKEIWTKPRGQKDEIFGGHETNYYWNDVPLKKAEYSAKIAELINENTFRMITNPLHFNQIMQWQDRRGILVDIAGKSDDQDIIARLSNEHGAARYKMLNDALGKKTIKELRAQLGSEMKKIKDDLQQIPIRISEANRSMPEPMDYDALHEEISALEGDLAILEEKLSSEANLQKVEQPRLTELAKRKGEIQRAMIDMEHNADASMQTLTLDRTSVITSKEGELSRMRSAYAELQKDLKSKQELLEKKKTLRDDSAKKWKAINAETFEFNDQDFCCPTCQRAFENVDIDAKKEELLANFNQNKSQRLEENVKAGKGYAQEIEALNLEIKNLEAKMEAEKAAGESLTKEIAALKEENTRLTDSAAEEAERRVKESAAYVSLKSEYDRINSELSAPVSNTTANELNVKRMAINKQITDLKTKLSTQGIAEQIRARIKELEDQERTMAQKLADLEAQEFGIEEFVRAQMEEVEQKVNVMFSQVRFKMFEQQVNGGFSETCTALINGVPFQDANTAAKINAGLDVINTLSKFYGVTAPIFIDNRESVLEIPDMEAQIIGLFVSGEHKKLKVEVKSAAFAK